MADTVRENVTVLVFTKQLSEYEVGPLGSDSVQAIDLE